VTEPGLPDQAGQENPAGQPGAPGLAAGAPRRRSVAGVAPQGRAARGAPGPERPPSGLDAKDAGRAAVAGDPERARGHLLQILLPPDFTRPLPPALLPALEGALLIGLSLANPVWIERGGAAVRAASIALILLITAANAASAVLLVRAILENKAGNTAGPLLATGASVWATNVIAFALWYWELDRGGPVHRAEGTSQHPDLMFPHMTAPELATPDWEPWFVDYLYCCPLRPHRPLTPYRRCITIQRQSGGGLCSFRGHPGPGDHRQTVADFLSQRRRCKSTSLEG
jgi:hypothetical protein